MTKGVAELARRLIDFWITTKIFHWQTDQYGAHKATDELLGELEEKTDEMLEIIQGATGARIRFEDGIRRSEDAYLNVSKAGFIRRARAIARYLMTINEDKVGVRPIEGLLNVRDEIIASIQQTLYLLSFR